MSGRLDVRVVIKCVHAFCLERLDVKFTIIVLCTLIGFFRKLDVSFVVIVLCALIGWLRLGSL